MPLTLIKPALLAIAAAALPLRREADDFLNNLPSTQPAEWSDAINLAIDGDSAALNRVRAARNAVPELPPGVVRDSVCPGIVLFRPEQLPDSPLPALIYLHGGGWTVGSANSCARFCAAIAASGQAMAAAIDYPLAPEHPFPEGLDFITSAVDKIHSIADSISTRHDMLHIGGDSSGGNLAIAAAMLRPEKLASLVLFYPVTFSDNDHSRSWTDNAALPSLDGTLMETFNRAYRPDSLKNHPLISPLVATEDMLTALPPTLLIGAERDILRDQGTDFIARLKTAGIDVEHIILPGSVHLFITVPGQPTAFSTAVDQTIRYITR